MAETNAVWVLFEFGNRVEDVAGHVTRLYFGSGGRGRLGGGPGQGGSCEGR